MAAFADTNFFFIGMAGFKNRIYFIGDIETKSKTTLKDTNPTRYKLKMFK